METTISANPPEVAEPVVDKKSFEEIQTDNWRETRELLAEQKAVMERLTRENAELRQNVQYAMNQPQQRASEDDDGPLDVYAEDFDKKLERKLEKTIERTYEKIEQKKKSDPAYLEAQAKAKYNDFDAVMTPDNIDTIIKSNPLVYNAVMQSGQPLEAAYALIKGSAAYQSKQQKPMTTMDRLAGEERQKMAENASKPKAPQQLARSQTISNVMGFARLTPSQAAEVHAETLRIKRGR